MRWVLVALVMHALPMTVVAQELPIFDAHVHYSHDAWESVPPKQAIDILRKAGVRRALVSSSNDEGQQKLYAEAGGTLKVATVSTGGGTDASYAALRTAAPVIEGLGLRSFGAHSNNAEYIQVSSIEPRLYLLTRMVMDAADGAVPGVR